MNATTTTQTTALLRTQARAAEVRLDWQAAADLWQQARERYPLMPGRREYGALALADIENMKRFEATCRAMERERVADRMAEMDVYTR